MISCSNLRRLCASVACLLALLVLVAVAVPGGTASAEPYLLRVENADGSRRLDLSLNDLQAMGRTVLETSTPWTAGVARFEGVPLKAVLDRVRDGETGLQAIALNDYVVDMPIDEVLAFAPLLAWARDGHPMSVRERGPFWLLFDFDRFPETRSDAYLSRSVWQLATLRLMP